MKWTLALSLVAMTACAAGPEPIRWGTDTCDQCRMVLDDHRFAAELVVGGRAYKFDGLDELGAYMAGHPGGQAYVVDAASGALVEADKAVLLGSPGLHGPMGGHVIGFASREAALRFASANGLAAPTWPTLKEALLARR